MRSDNLFDKNKLFPDDNNDILATTKGGTEDNININVEFLFGIQARPNSYLIDDIDASSDFGLDGKVSINVLESYPVQAVVELPVSLVQT
ncbi:MAG: hypothetical protein AAF652_04695 [Cyanobacteria bacterium P01_C01_bin.72]